MFFSFGFRTPVFPGARKARDIWRSNAADSAIRIDLPAYKSLAASGADRCGLTQLAGRTVGAPFVGAAVLDSLQTGNEAPVLRGSLVH
ncbi:MAG: hypothetical protein L0H73_06485 [Nitrococcus sp.]|nr:hypothetical protein [Nitrococcus sp.]